MVLDTLVLSRMQFAANISFHILFPSITIALGWFYFILNGNTAAARMKSGCEFTVLGENICPHLCPRCGERYHHEFSIRH